MNDPVDASPIEMNLGITLPSCCRAPADAEPGHQAYAAYNRAGDIHTAGLNYRGEPCPTWDELPENIRQKWRGAANVLTA